MSRLLKARLVLLSVFVLAIMSKYDLSAWIPGVNHTIILRNCRFGCCHVAACSSSRKVSHDWLDTLQGNNRTGSRNNAPEIAAGFYVENRRR